MNDIEPVTETMIDTSLLRFLNIFMNASLSNSIVGEEEGKGVLDVWLPLLMVLFVMLLKAAAAALRAAAAVAAAVVSSSSSTAAAVKAITVSLFNMMIQPGAPLALSIVFSLRYKVSFVGIVLVSKGRSY